MTPLSAYMNAISDRLAAVAGANPHTVINGIDVTAVLSGIPVLLEDVADLETQIDKAIDDEGILILIGEPIGDNTGQSVSVADDKITSAIAVGENPTINRNGTKNSPNTNPVCLDVVYAVMAALQGFTVVGFGRRLNCMRFDLIPNKQRQLYEITIESRLLIDGGTQ